MYKNFDPHKPYFYSVAMALILCGVVIFSVGLVEWISTLIGSYSYAVPFFKIIGGLVVIALGYIHLELELLRTQTKK